jgi:hypothetical protein
MTITSSPSPLPNNRMTSAVKGVLIRPNGDVYINHLARFSDKFVLPTDPIFHDVRPTEMSLRLNLPLLVQRLNPLEIVPNDAYHKNTPATILQTRPCTGQCLYDWDRKIGVVLVVRTDGKPLSCLHLEAMWKFNSMLLQDSNVIASWEIGVQPKVGRKNFEKFWQEYRSKQIAAGREEFESLGSPYDI